MYIQQKRLILFCSLLLEQVIIEGIGIFSMCLGKDFVSSGFMHSSLYLLLENLVSPNFHVRAAADTVLHVISKTSGYLSVSSDVNSYFVILLKGS